LSIIYGGFIGCTYALLWNQQMYKDYSRAYIDIMDDDPNTASYLKMLPLGYDISGREEQFKTIFKHKKDYYRKYRDLSIFAFIGVYLISVVDAYIDAQLSTFDISKDLSLHLEPAVFQQNNFTRNSKAVGLQCSFSFK
jgi:spermidine/putrescine-binding protein